MTVDILICTIDEGIGGIGDVLMPPIPSVHYVISVQYTTGDVPEIPAVLADRSDVTVTMLEGRGLSRNRNNALAHATADVVVISDDDCRYTPEAIAAIREAFAAQPEVDVLCFEAVGFDGRPFKRYPPTAMSYADARREGYAPASVELAFRRTSLTHFGLRFDERFGLGSDYPAGEEEVLLCDLMKAGAHIGFVPQVIVSTDAATTGRRVLGDARLQATKGAVFRRCYGVPSALWRTLKEGAHHFVYNHVNPLPIWHNMLRGILHNSPR